MELFDTSKSVIQELEHPLFSERNCRVLVKRDDLIDTEVSGNKWRKLKYYMEQAVFLKKEGMVTVGGAFSNHLLAVASACNKAGLRSIGVVRGEELTAESNHNLKRCADLGMELEFISRLDYADRNQDWFKEELLEKHRNFLFVPEGGGGYHGLIGCQELVKELPAETGHIFVAQGTCTTSAGILLGLTGKMKLHGVPVLKGFDAEKEMWPLLYSFLMDKDEVAELLKEITVHSDYHFGGYGKWNDELVDFIRYCKEEWNLPLDKVYTGKAFKALYDFVLSGQADHSTVVFIHTGGLVNG